MGAPRILIITPEISYLPEDLGNMAKHMHAKAGGLADVSASLVNALYQIGVDVHVAIPNYRRMFHIEACELIESELRLYHSKLPDDRIHLAEDRAFYYRDQVYSSRQKDFENPFRMATYRNKEEMTASIGTIEDNSFIRQVRKETKDFILEVNKILKAIS